MNTPPSAVPEFTVARDLDAPPELVFKAWTDPQCLNRWWGPKGSECATQRLDLRPGGDFLYSFRGGQGPAMWGRFVYHEVEAPRRLVFVNSFSDENGGTTRHPMCATWPLEVRNTLELAGHGGRTLLTLSGGPHGATDEECRTFDGARASLRKGFGGALDELAALVEGGGDPAPREVSTSRVVDAPCERVYRAWIEPEHLARWWGPQDFRNTFEEHDPRPGGKWRFTMHGPDGKDYPNESVYVDLVDPGRVVIDHVSAPKFRMIGTFEDEGGKTRVNFRMIFKTRKDCDALREFVRLPNEQNLDRLEAELARMTP